MTHTYIQALRENAHTRTHKCEQTHTHTHTVLKNTLEQAASMKAAIHIANLGALKRLHQMFSQKL